MQVIDLEYKILCDILTRDTFQEQARLLTELSLQDFKDKKNIELFKIFNNILVRRIKIDMISLYEYDKSLAIENLKLSQDISTNEYDCINRIRSLKERNYRASISETVKKLSAELLKENDTDKFDDIKNRMIVDLSQTDLDTGSKFINPVEYTAKIDENMKREAGMEGHSWGLADLDTYTSGIVKPRLTVIGGLKKTGKSRFVINTRFHLYKQKIPSVFLSLEMPGYEVTKLTYSRFTNIQDSHFRSIGFLSNEEKQTYSRVKNEIDWTLLPTECNNGLNIHQILQRLRMYQRIYKNPVVFIDYLQRIKHDRNRQAQELEEISNIIADATRLYDIPIILLSQMANIAEREQPTIGHLKGSGGIAESADIILLLDNLYRRSKQDSDKGKFEIVIEQRYGDSGKIKIMTDLGTCSFYDEVIAGVPNVDKVKDYYEKEEKLF